MDSTEGAAASIENDTLTAIMLAANWYLDLDLKLETKDLVGLNSRWYIKRVVKA